MTDRRFTDKPVLDPSAVWSLPKNHLALTENRTLFPSTVVDVDENFEDRLLVSGENNRKLGKTVAKGKFKGYALYGLSLEERATCSADCSARAYCYGNGMQMARRHRIGDMELFATFLEDEIRDILETEPGLLVRLHVLGDFPSAEYLGLWADLLEDHPTLACYGYTHWPEASEIGIAVQAVKSRFPDRFRIRWSQDKPGPDTAIVINEIPAGPRFNGALVCPAQTDATACCASCGMCWEGATKKETIAFIKHGKRSMDVVAENSAARKADAERRPVMPVSLPSSLVPATLIDSAPKMRTVAPRSLLIEAAYQRDLSGQSIKLIRKIVAGWDWSKFKPPVCAETSDGLFIIDGQHTAIAAASHPQIKEIPVVIISAPNIGRRAAAFVSHNRDRLAMTPAQIFYGDLAANDATTKKIMEAVVLSGASIPRLAPARGHWKPGQIAAVGELRGAQKVLKEPVFHRLLSIAVLSKAAPISMILLRALREILTQPAFKALAERSDIAIATAVGVIPDLEYSALEIMVESGCSKFVGAAHAIEAAISDERVAA